MNINEKFEQLKEGLKVRLSEVVASGRGFVKLEWSRWRSEYITEGIILTVIPILIMIGYMVGKTAYFGIASGLMSLPEPLYALMGISPQAVTGNIMFYVLFSLMILNVFLARRKCRQMVQAVWWEERNGGIRSFINQFVSRDQMAIYKYIWLVFTFVVEYLLWHVIMLLAILIGSINAQQRQNALEAMTRLFFAGGFVIVLLMSVAYLYAMKKKITIYAEYRIASRLVFGTLILGNIYKIRDLLVWFGDYASEKTSLVLPMGGINDIFGWLNELRWLSPLSWLNPYFETGGSLLWIRLTIGFVLSGVLFYLGLRIYRKRSIFP
ncbi:MAG: hypothetical protein LBV33_05645 [Lachnospiraceae bacterium]|nr:hypothetical protein [Lachnospiraceae bacterium]